jgi:carbamoyl-phosphate synthase large subunit
MENKTILVTGIGGNVGQGILRNIKHCYPNIKLIGTNVLAFSAGNHLCDEVFEVPYAYSENYIDCMINIEQQCKVDLIIPSTDFEIFYLSSNKNKFKSAILSSESKAASIFLDKYLTSVEFAKYNIPFAETILPSQFTNQFKQSIAKPKKGRGSRGIVINPKNVDSLPDTEYLIQELAIGKEVTTAFYITKQNQLLGHITMERALENGTTSFCKVVKQYDKQFEEIIVKMKTNFSICGSLNIQSIITSSGKIIPFEINARISGTNSIRSNFGFNDVIYGVDEWLFNKPLATPIIKNGIAVRVLMDVIYEDVGDVNEINSNTKKHIF